MDEYGGVFPGRTHRLAAVILGVAREPLSPDGFETRHWHTDEIHAALSVGGAAVAGASDGSCAALLSTKAVDGLVIPGGWYERQSFMDHFSQQRQPRLTDEADYPP